MRWKASGHTAAILWGAASSCVSIHIEIEWTPIHRLLIIHKSDLSDKIKRGFY